MQPSLRALHLILLCGILFIKTSWAFIPSSHLYNAARIQRHATEVPVEETAVVVNETPAAEESSAVEETLAAPAVVPIVAKTPPEPERVYIDTKTLPGITDPVGFFDPAGYSGEVDAMTIFWYRSAELKHGRIAMLACTGWLINALGIYWPGALDLAGTKFSDLGTQPLAAWDAIPLNGQLQVWLAIGLIEISDPMSTALLTEDCSPLLDGKAGLQFDPLGFASRMDDETLLKKQNVELNNGRLAMIGIISFFIAANYEGTVPLLNAMLEK